MFACKDFLRAYPWPRIRRHNSVVRKVGSGARTSVEQAQMRGLDTAVPFCVRGWPCLTSGVDQVIGHIACTGHSPFRCPTPGLAGDSVVASCGRTHFPCDRPDEAGEFARDRCDDDGVALSRSGQPAISPAQTYLGLPAQIDDRLGQMLVNGQLRGAHPRRMARDYPALHGPPGGHVSSKGTLLTIAVVGGITNSRIFSSTMGSGSGAIAMAVRRKKPCH